MDWSGTKTKKKIEKAALKNKCLGHAEDKQPYTNGEVSLISLILAWPPQGGR